MAELVNIIETPEQQICMECGKRNATTTYSDMFVCEPCSESLNNYFDEEYR